MDDGGLESNGLQPDGMGDDETSNELGKFKCTDCGWKYANKVHPALYLTFSYLLTKLSSSVQIVGGSTPTRYTLHYI